MTNSRTLVFVALLSAFSLTACVKVQGDVPSICKAQMLSFPGTGLLQTPTPVDIPEQGFMFSIGSIDPSSTLSEILLSGGHLDANVAGANGGGATANLDFIQRLRLVVAPPNGGPDEVTVLDYSRGTATNVTTIKLPPGSDNLLSLFVKDKGARIIVRATGSPPSNGWSLNTDFCVEAMIDKHVP